MVKINGVVATNTISLNDRKSKPSLNEIFNKLEKNSFDAINNIQSNSVKVESKRDDLSFNPIAELSNIFGDDEKNNLLLSILPTMLSKNKTLTGFKNSQTTLFKELLKNSNNPKLLQFAELLPKLMSKTSVSDMAQSQQKNEPKIDSFVKTDDYIDNE